MPDIKGTVTATGVISGRANTGGGNGSTQALLNHKKSVPIDHPDGSITKEKLAPELIEEFTTALAASLKRVITSQLPKTDIDTHTIYMIPSASETDKNIYDEYMYINGEWELIGSTAVDLTDYAKKADVVDLANDQIIQGQKDFADGINTSSIGGIEGDFTLNSGIDANQQTIGNADLVSAQRLETRSIENPTGEPIQMGDVKSDTGYLDFSHIYGRTIETKDGELTRYKQWRIIKSITVTEENQASSYYLDVDENGLTFELSEFIVYIKTSGTTTLDGAIRLLVKRNLTSGDTGVYQIGKTRTATPFVPPILASGGVRWTTFHSQRMGAGNTYWITQNAVSYAVEQLWPCGMNRFSLPDGCKNLLIKAETTSGSEELLFGVGTTIEIIGVDI